jgi:hypothetical protein
MNIVNLTTEMQWGEYGGNNSLWGTEWTAADINSPNFGSAFKGNCTCSNYIMYIDTVSITVHYGKNAKHVTLKHSSLL